MFPFPLTIYVAISLLLSLPKHSRVAAELGHRLTMHPDQFAQLSSPRKEVTTEILNTIASCCHSEVLASSRSSATSPQLPIAFARTILPYHNPPKTALFLRMMMSPILSTTFSLLTKSSISLLCLTITITISSSIQTISGRTKNIIDLYDRIKATWTRKGITQKMHYSEPTPPAVASQRPKHNPRVVTLPPCPPDMDLMIEAKDKEQAVFEFM
jgi:UV DNA damage endonuclease